MQTTAQVAFQMLVDLCDWIFDGHRNYNSDAVDRAGQAMCTVDVAVTFIEATSFERIAPAAVKMVDCSLKFLPPTCGFKSVQHGIA
jgi:hypothetical protein